MGRRMVSASNDVVVVRSGAHRLSWKPTGRYEPPLPQATAAGPLAGTTVARTSCSMRYYVRQWQWHANDAKAKAMRNTRSFVPHHRQAPRHRVSTSEKASTGVVRRDHVRSPLADCGTDEAERGARTKRRHEGALPCRTRELPEGLLVTLRYELVW
jgi:hypothetical protein